MYNDTCSISVMVIPLIIDNTSWLAGPLHCLSSLTTTGNKFGFTARTTMSQVSKTEAVIT